jgi:5-epi-alpha-selinene synthase
MSVRDTVGAERPGGRHERDEFPRILCPFPSGLSPHAAEVQRASLAWAERHQLVAPEDRAALARAKLSRLNARVFHGASAHSLQLAADWTTLFCILDDLVEVDRRSVFALSQSLDALVWSFVDGRARADHPLHHALVDLALRFRAAATNQWMDEFAERLREMFIGYVWEAINREQALRPSVLAYRKMRTTTIGLYPQFLLGELALGIALTREEKAHPVLQQLMAATSNCVGWANDMLTYEKELQQGEFHNLVLLLAEEQAMSVEDALWRVAALHNQELRDFLAIEAQLPSFSEAEEDVRSFIAMLKSWMRGHLDWAEETGRYRPRGSA